MAAASTRSVGRGRDSALVVLEKRAEHSGLRQIGSCGISVFQREAKKRNHCPRAQTPSHGCPTTGPLSNFRGDVGKFKKKGEARGKQCRKRAKKTQAAHNQPIERARVHGSEKWVSSDVVEAVAKFDAIRPSRWCTQCRCTWPLVSFRSAPTTRSEGGRQSTHVFTQCSAGYRAE